MARPYCLDLRERVVEAIEGGMSRREAADLNPIELSFATLKAHLRKAAKRTVPDIIAEIGKAIPICKTTDCHGYFKSRIRFDLIGFCPKHSC